MVKNAKDDQVMIDPLHPTTVSGQSIGNFTSGPGGGSTTSSGDGGSIAAETRYFTAVCAGCGWRGDPTTFKWQADDQAQQHRSDQPDHSVFIQETKAPT